MAHVLIREKFENRQKNGWNKQKIPHYGYDVLLVNNDREVVLLSGEYDTRILRFGEYDIRGIYFSDTEKFANSILDVMIGITGFTNHIVYEKYDPNSTKSVLNNALSKITVRELDAIKAYIAAEKN